MGGIGGRNFMLVRGENLPMKYPWGEPRGQVENVCPLGAEKGQNLPSSALRLDGKFFSTYDMFIDSSIFLKYNYNLN